MRDSSGGEALGRRDCLNAIKFQLQSIAREEKSRNRPRDPLVPVHKAMIPGKPERIRGGQICSIWLAVREQMLWASHRRFDDRLIPDASEAAMLLDQAIMNCIQRR